MIIISLSKLNSYLGQLLDLQSGALEEIVITKGEYANDLIEIVKEAIKETEAREQMEKEHDLEELKAAEAGTL